MLADGPSGAKPAHRPRSGWRPRSRSRRRHTRLRLAPLMPHMPAPPISLLQQVSCARAPNGERTLTVRHVLGEDSFPPRTPPGQVRFLAGQLISGPGPRTFRRSWPPCGHSGGLLLPFSNEDRRPIGVSKRLPSCASPDTFRTVIHGGLGRVRVRHFAPRRSNRLAACIHCIMAQRGSVGHGFYGIWSLLRDDGSARHGHKALATPVLENRVVDPNGLCGND